MKIHVKKPDTADPQRIDDTRTADMRGKKRGRHEEAGRGSGAPNRPRGKSKLLTRRDAKGAVKRDSRVEMEALQKRTRAEGGRKRRKKSNK